MIRFAPENKMFSICPLCGNKLLTAIKSKAECSNKVCEYKEIRNKPVVKKGCVKCGKNRLR